MVSQNMSRNRSFFENNLKNATTVNLNKCLKQINLPISLYMYAPISDLPSNISTMGMSMPPPPSNGTAMNVKQEKRAKEPGKSAHLEKENSEISNFENFIFNLK